MCRSTITRVVIALCAVAAGCARQKPAVMHARITREAFGTTTDGKSVDAFTLTNAKGLELRAITYGATIISLRVPDRLGHLDDIVLGYPSLAGYLDKSPYFGAVVGRYGNRIAKGRFTLDGKTRSEEHTSELQSHHPI